MPTTDDTATTAPLTLPTTKPPPKAGYKTTEFYAAWFVKLLGALLASGLLGTGTPAERIAGGLMALLAQLGYTGARTLVKTAPAAVLALILALGGQLTACATASQQETTLKTTLAATDAAETAFVLYDGKHQAELVDAAKTKPEGRAALDSYRARRDRVKDYFHDAYKALAAAALEKDGKTMDALVLAAGAVETALHALGVTP